MFFYLEPFDTFANCAMDQKVQVTIRFRGAVVARVVCNEATTASELKEQARAKKPLECKDKDITLSIFGETIEDDDRVLSKMRAALPRVKKLGGEVVTLAAGGRLTLADPLCFLVLGLVDRAKEREDRKREQQACRGGAQGGIKLIVRFRITELFELWADSQDTIRDIKYQVQKLCGADVREQCMRFCGKVLDDGLTLEQANLKDGSHICIGRS